ncbi:DUF4118 domain-containing protein [Desertihabitans brevis]|uniref:DUF4118 domain-containing protein n=1 Tax=Desertihabitans brevis TaxID=2268447 RepID=A0A367YX88_9ACTN|nr:DUF4118 domain-containing protein [Desertihabitans brevis]RCK69622.1 DUF4118 domain-containing protein [Desertihabitans brevis]
MIPTTADPVPPSPLPGAADWRAVLSWTAALALPAAAGLAAFLVGRPASAPLAAILLVLAVAVVAWVGGRWPGHLSAVVAGVAYDLGWTEPYDRFVIAAPEDVLATFLLVGVGIGVTWLISTVRLPDIPR